MIRKKHAVIAEWIELANGCLEDGPPKRPSFETWLFVNYCTVKQREGRLPYLTRKLDVQHLKAATKDELDAQVLSFVERPEVRLLVENLETNNFDILPREQKIVAPEIIDGSAGIYQQEVT